MKTSLSLVIGALFLTAAPAFADHQVCTTTIVGFPHHPHPVQHCTTVPDTCATIWRDPNFGGAGWTLFVNTASADVSNAMAERRSWHGYLHGWSGHDVSWDKLASSAKIAPGCTLTAYEGKNFTGTPHQYQAAGAAENAIGQLQPDNALSSYTCSCDHVVLPGGGWLQNPLP